MPAQEQAMTPYERKVQLILGTSLARYKGNYTAEQYAVELQVAKNILTVLGVVE